MASSYSINSFKALCVIVMVMLLYGNKSKITAILVVEPVWDTSVNDGNPCFLNISPSATTLLWGSSDRVCSLHVTALQGVHITVQILGNNHDLSAAESSFLYIERVNGSDYCSNKYVVFREEETLGCSAIFVHTDIQIVVQGNIGVFISDIPVLEPLPPCVDERMMNQTGVEVNYHESFCKNGVGCKEKFTCQFARNCRISFDMNCNAILGPNEVTFQYGNSKIGHAQKAMIVYPIDLVDLNLAENDIIEIHPKSFQRLTNLLTLSLDGNKLVKPNLGLFEGLPNLIRLTMNSNTLIALENGNQLTEMTTDVSLTQLQYLGLNNNKLQSLPDELFQNMINLKILDLGTNHIMQLDEGLFLV